jgi:hypothetical protein
MPAIQPLQINMNKLFLSIVLCCVFIITGISMHAQTSVKKQAFNNVAIVELEAVAPVHNSMADFRNIPIKAVRSFKNTWQHVDNETWYKILDGFRARFTEDGVLFLVTYNKKGKWVHTMRQYDETKLERYVRAQVKSVYYDYSIMLVEEIEYSMKPLTYIIHMEDKASFKNIKICDREMEVITEINKL